MKAAHSIRSPLALRRVAHLERQAAVARDPRPMPHPGRPARIGAGDEGLAQAEVGERTAQNVDLLPERMRLRPENAGVGPPGERQDPRGDARLRVAREDPLGETGDTRVHRREGYVGGREELAFRLHARTASAAGSRLYEDMNSSTSATASSNP